MTGLDKIKLVLDIDDEFSDELLLVLSEKCELLVRSVCGIFDADGKGGLVPLCEPLEFAVRELVVIHYNRLGSEGLSSETIGPLTMHYNDIPECAAAIINRYKRISY